LKKGLATARAKHSTRTVNHAGRIVPWLAAQGALAYTPENPPDRDYFFQYGWVIPGVIRPDLLRFRHYYFGACYRGKAADAFNFWAAARAGRVSRLLVRAPAVTSSEAETPIAVYQYKERTKYQPDFILIQHGSYQFLSEKDQPMLEQGDVLLYRGIRHARAFRWLRFSPGSLPADQRSTWAAYLRAQREMLSDSVLSFNSIHDCAVRCETSHLNDHGLCSDKVARACGLEIGRDSFAKSLWGCYRQGFSLARWTGTRKFGPNFVIFKTPVANIRSTSFSAGEFEARILDPNKLELLEASGCRLVEESPSEGK
jgi:hypothetical protein